MSMVCVWMHVSVFMHVHVCLRVRVIECEYWLGGIVLSRGHLSPAGPLALQLFRMCHRSVSQTGTQTHTLSHKHTHTHRVSQR